MSSNPPEMKEAIRFLIGDLMDRVMNRVLITDPFIQEEFRATKPLYTALAPIEIFKGAHFEGRFVTLLENVWKDLAVTAAGFGLGYGVKDHRIFGKVKSGRLRRVAQVLNALGRPERGQTWTKPDWNSELAYVLAGRGEDIPVQIVCDVFVKDTTNDRKFAFELRKDPASNSDITKVSKEKLLKLHAMEPKQVDGAYYALPYNPYGRREDYSWSFPARWFNMKEDEVVLIGDEFWDKIGGLGTYQAFIAAVNEIGREYKEQIYREFLGIAPPGDMSRNELR
ncbi:MAG: TdeIII family type II restriction endonuclease [Chloroflexota bacterium]